MNPYLQIDRCKTCMKESMFFENPLSEKDKNKKPHKFVICKKCSAALDDIKSERIEINTIIKSYPADPRIMYTFKIYQQSGTFRVDFRNRDDGSFQTFTDDYYDEQDCMEAISAWLNAPIGAKES